MNRYELCFSASKVLSFPEPAAISLKIIPPLKEIYSQEKINYDINEELMIQSSDDNNMLANKMTQMTNKDKEGIINREIFYKYFFILEEDDEKYKEMIKKYDEEKENDMNEDVVKLIKEKFKEFKKKDIKDVDVNKILVKIE